MKADIGESGAELQLDMTRLCDACGLDEVRTKLRGREYCQACFNELKYGLIINQNISFLGGGRATKEDDSGPWQQNAIRDLET